MIRLGDSFLRVFYAAHCFACPQDQWHHKNFSSPCHQPFLHQRLLLFIASLSLLPVSLPSYCSCKKLKLMQRLYFMWQWNLRMFSCVSPNVNIRTCNGITRTKDHTSTSNPLNTLISNGVYNAIRQAVLFCRSDWFIHFGELDNM